MQSLYPLLDVCPYFCLHLCTHCVSHADDEAVILIPFFVTLLSTIAVAAKAGDGSTRNDVPPLTKNTDAINAFLRLIAIVV